MKKELEASGRFVVDVATSPPIPTLPKPSKPKDETSEIAVEKYRADLAKYEAALPKFQAQLKAAHEAFNNWRIDFDRYDVVLSNYNGQSWPKEMNAALEERLKSGRIGLVIVHAANNAFGGWKEYNQMIGMGWRSANGGARLYLDDAGNAVKVPSGQDQGSGHRYTGPFTITIRADSHPVTRGMPREWMHAQDELYDNMRGPIENVHLLATAYSKGTQKNEPMIWTVSYGKGRVFHTPMGHDVRGMRCVGFMATLQRGTEWAATGTVTLPLPANFPTDKNISTIK
jgi:type 1 glutamine amidotransferase